MSSNYVTRGPVNARVYFGNISNQMKKFHHLSSGVLQPPVLLYKKLSVHFSPLLLLTIVTCWLLVFVIEGKCFSHI